MFKSMPILAVILFLMVTAVSKQGFAQEIEVFAKPVASAYPRTEIVTCEGVDGEVRFEMLFEIESRLIGPQAIAMRVSDPNVAVSRAEIAMFEYAEGLLNNNGNVVVGYVDPLNPKTGRKGERIGGTNLGSLRSIMVRLDLDFNVDFAATATPGKKHSAQAIYLKKIGEELVQDLDCTVQR